MKRAKQEVLIDLRDRFGNKNVITELEILKEYDSENNVYAKSFGVYKDPFPICILNVYSTDEISKALEYCNENDIAVIPRTGATSYEGLLTAISEDTVMIDASGMNKIISIDIENMMATCECGVPLHILEEKLQKMGYTTGHSPQSLPAAQMGGLVATRSIGQFSTYYGGIENMICGLEAVMPDGVVTRIRNVPRRSAGPDLRQLFIGSEGALGYITEVTVKIFTYYPDDFWKGGYIVKDFHTGIKLIRDIITAGYKPSVVRLYDKSDYDYNFGGIEFDDPKAFMFFVAEGPAAIAKATGEAIERIAKEAGCEYIGTKAVDHWLVHRNDLCDNWKSSEVREYFRENEIYYATNEISASWTDIGTIYENLMKIIPEKIDTLIMVGGHVSHSYQNGTNIYFVYRMKIKSPDTFAQEHQKVVDIISEEVLKTETGGCVHHHGMGKERVKFAGKEHGTSYILMKKMKNMMDPKKIMNPGALIEKK